jgi:hypothetical protein
MFTVQVYSKNAYRTVATSKGKAGILFKASLARIVGDAKRMRIKSPDGSVLLKRVYN